MYHLVLHSAFCSFLCHYFRVLTCFYTLDDQTCAFTLCLCVFSSRPAADGSLIARRFCPACRLQHGPGDADADASSTTSEGERRRFPGGGGGTFPEAGTGNSGGKRAEWSRRKQRWGFWAAGEQPEPAVGPERRPFRWGAAPLRRCREIFQKVFGGESINVLYLCVLSWHSRRFMDKVTEFGANKT